MYILSQPSVCLSLATFPHYCTDPDVTWRNGRGWPLVVHYWMDLQSVHGFRCYDNIVPNAKCHRMRVIALSLISQCSQLKLNRKKQHLLKYCNRHVATLTSDWHLPHEIRAQFHGQAIQWVTDNSDLLSSGLHHL